MKVYEEFIYGHFSRMASQKAIVAKKSFASHRMHDSNDKKNSAHKWFCEICEKPFQSASHLSIHRSTQHLKSSNLHHCRICFIGFIDLQSCRTHELDCKLKRYECFLCHHPSSYRNYLQDHMHQHSGFKNFKCEICGDQFFSTKPHLKRHLATSHLGIKKFHCVRCDLSFARKQHLLNHQNTKAHKLN